MSQALLEKHHAAMICEEVYLGIKQLALCLEILRNDLAWLDHFKRSKNVAEGQTKVNASLSESVKASSNAELSCMDNKNIGTKHNSQYKQIREYALGVLSGLRPILKMSALLKGQLHERLEDAILELNQATNALYLLKGLLDNEVVNDIGRAIGRSEVAQSHSSRVLALERQLDDLIDDFGAEVND